MSKENVMHIELLAENIDNPSRTYVADINLPASYFEINDAIDQCRGYLVKSDMMPLSISDCEGIPQLCDLRLDSTTLFELNYLAKQIAGFDDSQLAVYKAILPFVIGEEYADEIISVKDLINLTYCVDDYSIASAIVNDKELGEMLIDNGMVEGIENLPDEIVDMLDADKIGEAHRISENGIYIDGYYISREGFELKEVFNGEKLPENAVDTYLFRFCLSNDSLDNRWIDIPMSSGYENFFKATEGEEFIITDFKSAIPQIERCFDNPKENEILDDELIDINKFANEFLSADMMQRVKFKAALCYEEVNTLEDIGKLKWILNHADSYNLKALNVFPADFAKDYLEKHLIPTFPEEYLPLIDTSKLGDKLMDDFDGKYTPYGILLNNDEPIFDVKNKHEFELIEICGKHALFSDDRLPADEIPEGLYKYELRSGDEHIYATLEEKVGVNFSGTILSKVPFDLGSDEYIDLLEQPDDYPDFLDEYMGTDEFMQSDYDADESEDITGGMILDC